MNNSFKKRRRRRGEKTWKYCSNVRLLWEVNIHNFFLTPNALFCYIVCIWRQIVFRQNLLVRQWACWGNSKTPSYQIHLLDTWCCQSVIQENCDELRLKLWKFSGAYRAEQIKSKETMDKLPINQTQMNFKDSLARWVLWTEGSLIYTHSETQALTGV